jgi:hypothetical protein
MRVREILPQGPEDRDRQQDVADMAEFDNKDFLYD